MGKVFLSYRRKDSQGSTGRLHDVLADKLAGHEIFMDVDGIDPGEKFADKLRATLALCDAVLVVVGSEWLDGVHGKRLRDPEDHVHMEIAMALGTPTTRVIPVLVDEAVVPKREKLPPALKELFGRHVATLRHDGFRDDAAELAKTLRGILEEGDERRTASARGELLERDRADVQLAQKTKVDLSEHVEIHDTGKNNDCVAHAAACALQASMRYKGREVFADVEDLRQQIESHDRIQQKGQGTWMTTPIYVIEQFGVELVSDRPAWLPPARAPRSRLRSRIKIVQRLTGAFFRIDDYWRIPVELARGRPVFACIKAYRSFLECEKGRVKAPAPDDEFTFGHAFVIVGWSPKGIRFANNRGVKWGDKGYGSIDHAVAQQMLFLDQMWAIEADPGGEPKRAPPRAARKSTGAEKARRSRGPR